MLSTSTLIEPSISFKRDLCTAPTVEIDLAAAECPEQHQRSLQELKEALAKGGVPNCYYYLGLEEFLSVEEKAKLTLFKAIQTGLNEAAAVFQPKRYKSDYFQEKVLAETTLWFRAFWPKHVTASQASKAFQSHTAEGRRFPAPVDVLDRVTDVGAEVEKPVSRKYF